MDQFRCCHPAGRMAALMHPYTFSRSAGKSANTLSLPVDCVWISAILRSNLATATLYKWRKKVVNNTRTTHGLNERSKCVDLRLNADQWESWLHANIKIFLLPFPFLACFSDADIVDCCSASSHLYCLCAFCLCGFDLWAVQMSVKGERVTVTVNKGSFVR